MSESGGEPELELLLATEDQSFGSAVVEAVERVGGVASVERVEPAAGGSTQRDTAGVDGAIVDGRIAEPAAVIECLTETAELPVAVLSDSPGGDDTVARAIEAGATDIFPRTTASAQYELAVERLLADDSSRSAQPLAKGETTYWQAYEALFEKISEGLVVHDPETGVIVDVNERFCEMNGYEQSELLGESIGTVLTDEEAYSPEAAKEMIQQARTEGPQRFEWRNQHRDGETFPVEVDLAVIELGDAERVLASVQDITERKRREQEYEQIFNSVQDAITVHDPKTGEMVDVNETFCKLVGYDRETILEMGTTGVSVPAEGYTEEYAEEIIAEVMSEGQKGPYEWMVETKDGERRVTEVVATRGEIGGEERIISINRDVTERKRREREYEEIFDGVNDIIAIYDPKTREMVDVNQRMCELTGYDEEMVLELGIEGLLGEHPSQDYAPGEAPVIIDRVMSGEDIDPYEQVLETSDGEPVWIEVNPTRAVIGGEERFVAISRDVTERKRREREYEQIFNGVKDPIAVFDPDTGDITEVNEPYHEMIGYDDPETIRELGIEGLSAGEEYTGERGAELIREVSETGDPMTVEWEAETAGGDRRYLDITLSPAVIRGEERVLTIQRDVTERKRREREYEQIFNMAGDGIVIHDPESGEVVDANQQVADLLGYDRETFVDRPMSEFQAAGEGVSGEQAREKIRESVDMGGREFEWPLETSDGETVWVRVRHETGRIDGERRIVAMFQDITERRRREQEFEQIFNGVQDAIAVFDPDTLEYLDANEAYLEMFDHESVSKLRERGVSGLSISEDGYTEQRGREVHQRVVESGQPEIVEWQGETSGGERIWLEVKVAPAVIGGEQRTIAVQRDITERKRREQRLEVFNRILRHNLRNQLDVIQSHAEALATWTTGGHAERIVAAADELAGIGRRARQVDRILSTDDMLTEIDVAETLSDTLETMEPTGSDVAVTTELPKQARLWTDEETVTMAVESALENALEHAASTVTVAVDDEPEECVITIADDGPGIPEEELMPIEAETETRLEHGRGLGLWQLRWCVDSLNGELSFETESGTTVRITVPDRRDPGRPG